ncbi:SRPBCC domain-containing protein [Leptolyngbya sp. NIES-2104]|uniref:SRPBCC domain-containing protein n=1 Tax=Leptolyngbya sp. NIES-2104 TaxID=1552121 RepID=UPI0006EC4C11|nr:SRPBCC domain-containing protein [Leptolyngbya sp. NIES-2104]GAP99642.1 transcriptional regulator, ArsR family [Leptolyngbya sp. NIES-2104]
MSKPTFVYVTYIATTIEQLWEAITSESFVQHYWEEGQLQSDWQVGSPVEKVNLAGELQTVGEVLQSEPPHQLSYTFQFFDHTQPSRVRFLLEPSEYQVKLTVIHDRLEAQSYLSNSDRWTMRLSDLKRLLELESAIAWIA